ncbi:pancreatic lipase-related protein 2 isoform X1 [Plutella xylostella]|uniref:pancreatic lipase-related protein 2 isoform X1 n=1 Tax=Plutella xylostella TaxID=51655 RepID=UPI0020327396|nr:pancreatic lipase-related protein 2 isoform X1 [Plutella xylostella]
MALAEACTLMRFFVGVTEVCFMSAPVGDCSYCCPRNDALDIIYKLFTRSNPTEFQVIVPGNLRKLETTNFNQSAPTVIYLMGFSEATTGPSTTTIRDAYLSTGEYNFISVDWSRLIAGPWYVSAVQNTRYMGVRLAKFIQFLSRAGVPPGSVHVVGFSLGAEAAGFTGKALREQGVRLGRITGLDPAYPGYKLANSDGHLSKGDAQFVDVLHSNPGIFGFPEALGDVDFYPNPGSYIQRGCWLDQLVKNREVGYIYGCSHNRAWRLYAETIRNPRGFPATLCRDWTSATRSCQFHTDGYMGFGAKPPMQGKMYLLTNEKPPYARNGP